MLVFEAIDASTVSAALDAHLGIVVAPARLQLTRHDWRWMARLPDGTIAQLAPTAIAAARLLRERRMLAAIAPRLSFSIPRPIGAVDAPLDLRMPAPGVTATRWRSRLFPGAGRGAFADDLGRILAELHTACAPAEARALCAEPASLPWPMPVARLRERADDVLPRPLRTHAHRAIDRYAQAVTEERDLVLVHGDVGTHNLTFDPTTHRLSGLFDFEEFALLDRYSDFKYLPTYGESVLERAVGAYEAQTGVALSLRRIHVEHAVTALSFVIWRAEHPDAGGMGRAPALAWLVAALLRVR